MKPSTLIHWKSQIEHAIAISHDDPFGSLDLKEVADRLNESPDNFSHKFAALYGEPFAAFNKRRRLEAGAGELRHSSYNIAEIAERCGYTLASFSRGFRELYNESPTAFRNRRFLSNEENTLTRAKIITSPHDDPNSLIFNPDKTIDLKLPESTLYYNILPGQNDPIQELMYFHSLYHQQHMGIKDSLIINESMVVLGTLDVVPVTPYHRMKMYLGILVPKLPIYNAAHLQIQRHFQPHFRLYTKSIAGGNYKKLIMPMSYAKAGLPMYQFINNSCREGYFKMSNNHFFISLLSDNCCEVYIPWLKI
ncbi:AraC family transcriptional regulator [Chitinophaga silvatica]|uniref:AraC family transcriptional regulator n=1 Tax=Chitinophaga silvatica TaxID=2282649 RepID=A0A3E1YBW8_9BACT|nr:helix-turn-helix transcriptional regulator [Chitinophaga silvatica]RFS23827.1 AraC family transcriptional regulator [Chitinophaga silvatica]